MARRGKNATQPFPVPVVGIEDAGENGTSDAIAPAVGIEDDGESIPSDVHVTSIVHAGPDLAALILSGYDAGAVAYAAAVAERFPGLYAMALDRLDAVRERADLLGDVHV